MSAALWSTTSRRPAPGCARSLVIPDSAQFPAGVEVVGSAAAGCRGASAVFLNSRALGDELATVVDLARREGVTRLVALSAINADDDFSRQPSRFRGDRNKEVEQYAVDSGLEWVSLRPTVFATNFFGMWAPQIKAGDVVSGPYAAASTAPIVDARHLGGGRARAAHRRAVGAEDPADRPAGADQHRARRASSAPSSVAGCAIRRFPPSSCVSASSVSGFSGRVRRRVHGVAVGDGVQARTGHPRGGEDPGPSRAELRRRGSPLTAICSPTSKGDKTCRNYARPATSSR